MSLYAGRRVLCLPGAARQRWTTNTVLEILRHMRIWEKSPFRQVDAGLLALL